MLDMCNEIKYCIIKQHIDFISNLNNNKKIKKQNNFFL